MEDEIIENNVANEENAAEGEGEGEDELPVFEKFTIIPNHPIKKLDECYEDFELLVDLNEDTGATILTGTKINDTSGKRYALKIVEKAKIADDKLKIARLKREVKIYNKVRHCKHVVNLYEIIETDYDMTFVMDFVDGGQLFDKVAKAKGMRLSEKDASRVVRQLTECIQDLHSSGVCHRDLKPENILCTKEEDGEFNIKLIDFGLAKFIKIDNGAEILKASTSGTLAYVAPERFDSNDTKAIDIWSIGIIMYFVLFGNTPFCDLTQDNQDEEEVFKNITSAPLKLPPKIPISRAAKEVLAGCLKRDPSQRWTCQKILEHSWVQGEIQTVLSNSGSSPQLENIGEEDYQKLKASMSMVINASRDIQDKDKN